MIQNIRRPESFSERAAARANRTKTSSLPSSSRPPFPGNFASTTETTDFVLQALGLGRGPCCDGREACSS